MIFKSITGSLRRVFRSQFIRFLFVGFINTIIGYGVFALLLYSGLHYSLALFLATLFGISFNFKSTGIFVFNNKGNKLIIRFAAFYMVLYFINLAFVSAISLVIDNNYISAAITLLPMAAISFLMNKRFVFKYA